MSYFRDAILDVLDCDYVLLFLVASAFITIANYSTKYQESSVHVLIRVNRYLANCSHHI